jgi:hypothetical protein
MRHAALILTTALLALALAAPLTAGRPTREVFPAIPDFVSNDCDFPVLFHSTGPTIITTFSDMDGNIVRQIQVFPGNRQALTNLETGKTRSYVTNGPLFFDINPDGSGSLTIAGPSLGLQVTGEPGMFWTAGRFVLTFDADGNTTSIDFQGRVIDVCAELAA